MKSPLVLLEAPAPSPLDVDKSPKSAAFPVELISTYSITLTVDGVIAVAETPLVKLAKPHPKRAVAVKSPKSVASPVVEMVI